MRGRNPPPPRTALSIALDGETGRANQPLTPIADRNHQALAARLQYKVKPFLFVASKQANYNTNSAVLSTCASHAPNYNAGAAWMPREWFTLDASYSKLHLNTAGGTASVANSRFIQGEQSIYVRNLHVANVTALFGLKKRADLLVRNSPTRDTGNGGSTPLGPGSGSAFQF